MTSDADATIMSEDMMPVKSRLNFTSFSLDSATKRQLPRILVMLI